MIRTIMLCMACLTITGLAFADDSPTVDDILRQLPAAQSLPVRYRMRIANSANSIEAIVSQKLLANGVLATRTEAVAPSQTILVCLDGKCYEVLPQSKVVIDKTQIKVTPATAHLLRCNEMSFSFVPEIPEGVTVLSRKATPIMRGQRQCY